MDHQFPTTVDEAAARAGRLKLKFKIKAEKTHGSDKEVGRVEVTVKELLEQDGKPKVKSYSLRLPSGKTKGVLEFAYKFGERFTMAALPPPVVAYPPTSSLAAGYPPPPLHWARPYPPLAGYRYPLQGYPLNVALGYSYPPQGYAPPPLGYVYPPAVYGYPLLAYQQKPPKKSGRNSWLVLGCGLLPRLLIGDIISDALEAATYDAGLDDALV